ncbi:MAG: tRNA (adenosine(37)-N6)-dimethylallyltransferase MiaA [Mariprofundaceae bacterium]|nr:tRNA (adenosine(37)-N6)-dimethylallyltransferase MiaA [Mariprofundaceae bacterium]
MLRCVALVGPTASGKSSLAMRVAASCQTSLMACDSMQVYQGLDIGTAKASKEDQLLVPHALIDCVTLPTVLSAADWVKQAVSFIQKENDAGRTPILVGGCGFYLRALLEGLSPIPEENQQRRDDLTQQWQVEGNAWLHQQVEQHDPASAARLHASDIQRLLRALAVYHSTGVPLSQWQKEPLQSVDIDCPVFVLDMPRENLYVRINQRFDVMMNQGWMQETQWLLDQKLADTHPAMRAVGYRQLLDVLHGHCSEEDAVIKGKTATRRYAKRQQTWFRHQLKDSVFADAFSIEEGLKVRLQGQ